MNEKVKVKCPYCGKNHILTQSELEELNKYGKCVVSDCGCNFLYTVRKCLDCDDENTYFTR